MSFTAVNETDARANETTGVRWEAEWEVPEGTLMGDAEFDSWHENRGAELVDGVVEYVPMPERLHELFGMWLRDQIVAHGVPWKRVFVSGYKVRIRTGSRRQPNCFVIADDGSDMPAHAVHVVFAAEVITDRKRDRKRDEVDKVTDYAEAGVGEYWLIDPARRNIRRLVLTDGEYSDQGTFGEGEVVESLTFTGLSVDVSAMFADCE